MESHTTDHNMENCSMKIRWTRIVLTLLVLTILIVSVTTTFAADKRYVSDQLVITLREGMGNKFRVITTIKTDTPMEVLSAQDNYLYVRLDDGKQGYVLKRYVAKKTPKTTTIATLRKEIAALEAKLAIQLDSASDSKNEVTTLQQQLLETANALQVSEDLLKTTQEQLSDLQVKAENVVLIDEDRQRLKKSMSVANKELEALRHDNAAILKTAMIKWFLAGGGVLFLGWIAGKFSRKKKRGLGSF